MFPKKFRRHAACTYESQSTRIAYSSSQSPSAGPYHAGLDDWEFDVEERSYSVLHLFYWTLGHWVIKSLGKIQFVK
jgi:hypothetical protein